MITIYLQPQKKYEKNLHVAINSIVQHTRPHKHEILNNQQSTNPTTIGFGSFYNGIATISYKEITSFKLPSRKLPGLRGRDRMVVGFTTTSAISAYHH